MMKLIKVSLVMMAFMSSSMAIAGGPVHAGSPAQWTLDQDKQANAIRTACEPKKKLLNHLSDKPRQIPIGIPGRPTT